MREFWICFWQKQYSAAKEQILILVVTVVLVSLTARACELMFRHYTEPSALETKKKTAQKTFLMEYEELEKGSCHPGISAGAQGN